MMSRETTTTRIIALPSRFKGKQLQANTHTLHVETELLEEFDTLNIVHKILPGQKIAVVVGNQGITNLVEMVKVLIRKLQSVGAEPFIIPAVSSGERISAAKQIDSLAKIGITKQSVGVPVSSAMETILIGESPKGIPVFIDRYAYEADGIIVLNRTKFHKGIHSDDKSGLMRMITIGLGKQSSASMCRSYGSEQIADNIAEVARFIIQATHFLFGIAVGENPYHETTQITCVANHSLLRG